MKKFSNISGEKVNTEPKLVKNEADDFKFKLMDLIDSCLHIQTYGPIDRYLRAGTLKIKGKDALVEALISLMSDRNLKDQNKLLESLKLDIGNWEMIDSKIETLNEKIDSISEKNKTLNHRNKLISLYENWGGDLDFLMKMVEVDSNKISSPDAAELRALTARFMSEEGNYPSDVFKNIAEKFENRANQLKTL